MRRLLCCRGDGIGPEVTAAAQLVLQEVSTRFGHNLQLSERLMGGCAIDPQRPADHRRNAGGLCGI
ncbi:3-isopropylmalate dehydrogenase [Chloroflexota bacterium]|nr:3-isopropylmalate dehydrogenase [Chloroflexota bacterium]